LYITNYSGHHRASLAIEGAIKKIIPRAETMNLNILNYANPVMEKIINKAYMGVIKGKPEIWEYLYDNPKVLSKIKGLRESIHRYNSPKLRKLIEEFRPDGIICTQAFPCGMIADYKKSTGVSLPLMGVLTDYAPHSYWIYDNVDVYVVPSEATGRRLIENGIYPDRVKAYGIPIDVKFCDPIDKAAVYGRLGLSPSIPVVLVMGGAQGLGMIKEAIVALNTMRSKVQILAVTGTNRSLYKWLTGRSKSFKNKTLVYSFVENIEEFMGISSLIITKAGGITASEALCMGLPMLILHPLPGQETMNANFLVENEVAIKAGGHQEAAIIVESLLNNESKLQQMKIRAKSLSKPDSALNIAKHIDELTL